MSSLPSARSAADLFAPTEIAGVPLRNRFVMAPMTRRRSPGGVPTPSVADYYRRRAEHGVGLIITEGVYVDHPLAGDQEAVPHLRPGTPLSGWRSVVDGVHAEGGKIFAQLWHIGSVNASADAISPSGLDLDGRPHGRAMTAEDIEDVLRGFVSSALLAQEVGFDGVEVHAAHGYLIDQFLWSVTNRREDGYGGTLLDRVRIAAETVRRIRGAVGPAFPISFRFSQYKIHRYDARIADDPEELEVLLGPIIEAGASMLHASARRYWQPAFAGSALSLAGWTKRISGLPTIAVGSVGLDVTPRAGEAAPAAEPDRMIDHFARGEFDLLASGRSLLVNPDWVSKSEAGRQHELRAYHKQLEDEFY